MRIRIGLVVVLLLVALGSQAGRFLVVDTPQNADVIVVLAGESSVRPAHAVELLRKGLAPYAFFDVETRDTIYDQHVTELAQRYISALPEKDRIGVCPIVALSTYAEADDVNRCLQGRGVHSILLVSSASHTRRARRIFQHRLPQYQVAIAAAQDPTHFGTFWWTNREWAKTTLDEWVKLTWWELVDRWR